MIMIKKAALTLIATLLVATLTACGSTPAASSGDSSSSSESVAAPPSSQSQEMVAPAREYVKGVKTETSYSSEFWGIQFVPPNDNIMIASDEQIAEVIGMGMDTMGTDPNLAKESEGIIGQYELMAIDLKHGATIMILSEELPLSFITEEVYLSGMKQGIEQVGESVTIEYDNNGEFTTEMIGGKSFTTVSYTMTGGGVPTNYQKQYVHIDGKRVLVVSIAYPPELAGAKEAADAALAAITVLEPQTDEQSSSKAE